MLFPGVFTYITNHASQIDPVSSEIWDTLLCVQPSCVRDTILHLSWESLLTILKGRTDGRKDYLYGHG